MIRAPVPNLAPGERRLEGGVAHYLARVLRLRAGDVFVAFDPASGREAEAVTVRAELDVITVRLGSFREAPPDARLDLTWIQGLAKGDKCNAVVRDATELGVTRIIVAATRRSVVKLDPSRARERKERWERVAREAARQCGRSDAPTVDLPCAWVESLESVPADAARFCLWERATRPLGPALFDALALRAPLVFACGPEGGLEEAEVRQAEALGFAIASLGPLALRTETCAAAVLGAVRVWSGWAQESARATEE